MRRGDDLGPNEPEDRLGGREPPPPPERRAVTPKQILVGLLAIVLLAFAIANFGRVKVNFLLFETQARVVTVIVVAGILGFVIGYYVGRPSREQRKRLRKTDED
jgi:uncharacterized integral membrane protein